MKNTIWILALLLLTFLGDRLGGWILKGMLESSQFRYSRMYTGQAECDILLVGNSRGLIFYQPHIEEITGKSTLNLSYNGMSVDLMNVLVEDYFEKYEGPAQMIIDVTMCDRVNDQLTAGFNLYGPYSNRLENFIIDRTGNMGYGAKVSHLFRYNSEIFQRAMFYSNKSDEDWLLDRVINQNMIDAAVELDTYKIDLYPDTTDTDYLLKHLNAMISTAKSKGTEVKLVINPYYPAFAKSITNLDAFKSDIETKTGMKVYDYSQAIQETKGFGDYQHLNKTGAKTYVERLFKDGIIK